MAPLECKAVCVGQTVVLRCASTPLIGGAIKSRKKMLCTFLIRSLFVCFAGQDYKSKNPALDVPSIVACSIWGIDCGVSEGRLRIFHFRQPKCTTENTFAQNRLIVAAALQRAAAATAGLTYPPQAFGQFMKFLYIGFRNHLQHSCAFNQRQCELRDSLHALHVTACTASRSIPQRSAPLTIL